MTRRSKAVVGGVLIAAVIAAVVWVSVWATQGGDATGADGAGAGPSELGPESSGAVPDPGPLAPDGGVAEGDAGEGDVGAARVAELFRTQQTDVQVRGEGVVVRVLSDDVDGDRHQRFILRLSNGMTLLVAHNIDDFPRLDGLADGDVVGFNGEYVWGEQGGTIHWTHRDNQGDHADGWLEWNGRRYW